MAIPGSTGKQLFPLLLSLIPALASAGIYSWTDDSGKVHFGDRPPPERAAEEVTVRINTYSAPSDISRVDGLPGSTGNVVLYTTQRCGYCAKAKRYLQKRGIAYTEYDVETSRKGKRDFKKLKGRGVPIILVGNQRMNGFSEGRMTRMLEKAGYGQK